MYQDRYLTCRDCGNEFVFSASEQEFFAEKGFANDPGRCPSLPRSPEKREAEFRRRLPPEAPDVPGGMRQLRERHRGSFPAEWRQAGILQ